MAMMKIPASFPHGMDAPGMQCRAVAYRRQSDFILLWLGILLSLSLIFSNKFNTDAIIVCMLADDIDGRCHNNVM